ncbi:MAG: lytic transglycosylase domain-containing protein [Xanthobacteraceae bacterium]|nr:MAG: lytic transglycosylase domain-containing protein [Xanthobacteraceae bacterium]
MAVDTAGTATGLTPARLQITGAIRQASSSTGISFEYLLAAAKIESNLNPAASASTSSARGLYQFIEQTWLGTVKEAGAALGYGQYASAITRSASGRYSVSDPAMRQEILKLRDDPVASAAMAGVLTRSNGTKLAASLGREPTNGELYIAHFLGVGGAARLIERAESTPWTSAAALFPGAASANRSIFYDRSGRARGAGEVYGVLTGRYASAANSLATQTALAAMKSQTAAAAEVSVNAVFLAAFPPAGANAANPATGSAPLALVPTTLASSTTEAPMFRTLFQGGDRTQPVSPAVRQLWQPAAAGSPDSRVARGFDLFSDPSGRFSG